MKWVQLEQHGSPFSSVYGTFSGYEIGPFTGNGTNVATILPVTEVSSQNTPGAFTMNGDGTVTINTPGVYLITSRVQVATPGTAAFNFTIIHADTSTAVVGLSAVEDGGTATVTTLTFLQIGDRVYNGLPGTATVNLIPTIGGITTPTSMFTLTKIN
ncbi:MAG: hypothetical protein PHR25_04880 [Clostridia bacterium]|nr:hypothetical protein [Clostridia bacterium]